jgi:hypothetical protein
MKGTATEAMIAHRYGGMKEQGTGLIAGAAQLTGRGAQRFSSMMPSTPAQPQRTAPPPTPSHEERVAALTGRPRAIYRAGIEFHQLLKAMGSPANRIITSDWSSFAFRSPFDQVVSQLAPEALKIAARYGTGVALMKSWLQGYPETVLVIADDATKARRYFGQDQVS